MRTDPASAIWFDAALERVADALALLGDGRARQPRRATAVGILAHPQQALDPADAFPYGVSARDSLDLDHTEAYLAPDRGGGPGQTRTADLAPLTRFHHRVKTFGGWSVAQPFDGILVWRSAHGRHYLVDHTGTHRLG